MNTKTGKTPTGDTRIRLPDGKVTDAFGWRPEQIGVPGGKYALVVVRPADAEPQAYLIVGGDHNGQFTQPEAARLSSNITAGRLDDHIAVPPADGRRRLRCDSPLRLKPVDIPVLSPPGRSVGARFRNNGMLR